MCRWFVYISPEPELLEDVLIDPDHAITKQVNERYLPGLVHWEPGESLKDYADKRRESAIRNVRYNPDGFGVAWYTETRARFDRYTTGPRPALYRTVAPPVTDRTFLTVCANTSSKCIMAHIRAASRPPVVATNNHPFVFGRHTFMHNGTVTFFPQIRKKLVEQIDVTLLQNIGGNTDSEHVGALYLTFLGAGGDNSEVAFSLEEMRNALLKTIQAIIHAQKEILSSEDFKNSANGLNLCATDGEQLVATRFRNHPTEQPASLYWSDTAGIVLDRRYPGHPNTEKLPDTTTSSSGHEHAAHLIIASEPSTKQPKLWNLIPKNTMIIVDRDGHSKFEAIKYDAEDSQSKTTKLLLNTHLHPIVHPPTN